MDTQVENLDFSKYDMLWLGGDLAYLTSLDEATISYVDSIFDLSNQNTLLSLGNHDYSDLERINRYTLRPNYYSYSKNGLTIIVLDTQDSLSNIRGDQLIEFNNILDTLQSSSHLIILTHKLIWMYNHKELHDKIDSVSNGYYGDCSYCVNPNNFYTDIYPKLLEIQNKGIEVICIAGDIGKRVKQFEYQTKEGVYFIASGIDFNKQGNKALLLTHNLSINSLQWEFISLDEL